MSTARATLPVIWKDSTLSRIAHIVLRTTKRYTCLDPESICALVLSLCKWKNGMQKNKARKDGADFWKCPTEKAALLDLFNMYLAKRPCSDLVDLTNESPLPTD